MHAIAGGVAGHGPIGRKQGQLPGMLGILVKGFDRSTSSLVLAIVDLAEIKHLTLHDLAADAALAFDNAPIMVLLAVFEAPIRSQIHGGNSLHKSDDKKDTWSPLQEILYGRPLIRLVFLPFATPKSLLHLTG
uniref:hypothetical protein n=1 Tax=Mesorhizobium sp. L-8-3 TaxID=2744522 RepID=UPI001927CD7A|nr:hypothetical protein [Mesorhizobium sp. L-8-3]